MHTPTAVQMMWCGTWNANKPLFGWKSETDGGENDDEDQQKKA